MGTRTRGNKYEGETYRVRTGSELTGVVSERVLTPSTSLNSSKDLAACDFAYPGMIQRVLVLVCDEDMWMDHEPFV